MFIAYNERTGDVSPLATKSKAADSPKSGGAEGVEGAIRKASLVASAEAKSLHNNTEIG